MSIYQKNNNNNNNNGILLDREAPLGAAVMPTPCICMLRCARDTDRSIHTMIMKLTSRRDLFNNNHDTSAHDMSLMAAD